VDTLPFVTFFMGYLKSMSSAMRTSWSKMAAAHFWERVLRWSWRQRMTRAEPCGRGEGGRGEMREREGVVKCRREGQTVMTMGRERYELKS
jgi:hypothetical protein